jgi:uncharacterized protein
MSYIATVLVDEIKARITRARREKDDVARDVLGLALGEIQTAEARANRSLRDDEAVAVVLKLLKSNEETLSLASEDGAGGQGPELRALALRHEIQVLSSLIPATLSPDSIERELASVADEVRAAKSEGQAMGVAMKHIKTTGARVESASVLQAIQRLRR